MIARRCIADLESEMISLSEHDAELSAELSAEQAAAKEREVEGRWDMVADKAKAQTQ